jgi:hypothetical protein
MPFTPLIAAITGGDPRNPMPVNRAAPRAPLGCARTTATFFHQPREDLAHRQELKHGYRNR